MSCLRISRSVCLFPVVALAILSLSSSQLSAQTQRDPASELGNLWNLTANQSTDENLGPRPAHSELNGHVTDRQTTARVGFDGHYAPYLASERDTLRVDATTLRTTSRTFSTDSDASRTLTQLTEEEQQTLPDGTVKTTRTISSADSHGRVHVTRRETEEVRQISPTVRESEMTVSDSSSETGVATVSKIELHESRASEHIVEFRRSVLLPDGHGGWQPSEIREGQTKDDGHNRTTEERVSKPMADGKMMLVTRIVTTKTEVAPGQTLEVVETYSGAEGAQQLERRVTTFRWPRPQGGEFVEEQVEQRSSPAELLMPGQKRKDVVLPGFVLASQIESTAPAYIPSGDRVISIDTKTGERSTVNVNTSTPNPH